MLKNFIERFTGVKLDVKETSQKEVEVFFEVPEAKECIINWTRSISINKLDNQSELEEFVKIIKAIGIKVPIYISNFDQDSLKFTCTQNYACSEEPCAPVTIRLITDTKKSLYDITVSENNIEKCYETRELDYYSGSRRNNEIEEMYIKNADGRKIIVHYGFQDVFIRIRIDQDYELEVGTKSLGNNSLDKFYEYMFGLTNSLNIYDVYRMAEKYLYNNSATKEVEVYLIKKRRSKEEKKDQIVKSIKKYQSGRYHKFEVRDNDEDVTFSNGWEYKKGFFTMTFDGKNYAIKASDNKKEELNRFNYIDAMNHAIEKVNSIMKSVK